jgi:hypothetical protein
MDGLDDAPKGGYRAAGVILPRAQQSARGSDRAVREKATEAVRKGHKPQSGLQDPASATSGTGGGRISQNLAAMCTEVMTAAWGRRTAAATATHAGGGACRTPRV